MYDGVSVFLSCKSALSSLIRRRLVAAPIFLFTSLFAWTLPLSAQMTTTSNLSFPTTAIGSSAVVQNVLLQTTAAEIISSVSVPASLGGVQEYVVGAITGCTLGASNPSGTTCTVPITFTPAYPGQRWLPLQVVTSNGNVNFGLEGIGTGPQATISPDTITTVAMGSTTWGVGNPSAVAVDAAGNLYYADYYLYKVTPSGINTIVATGMGDAIALAFDASGNLYIADGASRIVRKMDFNGIIATIFTLPTTSRNTYTPTGMTVDSSGYIYISMQDMRDNDVGLIYKLNPDGTQNTITPLPTNYPMGLTMDAYDNLFIASINRVIYKLSPSGVLSTIYFSATTAEINQMSGIATDAAGDFYIAELYNNRIRKVDVSGIITTVAGTGIPGYTGDNGPATNAQLNSPEGIALDASGNLYIADSENNRIRKVFVNRSLLNYPTATNIGNADGTDNPQTVTISNTGNTALLFTIPATGTNPSIASGFAYDAASTCPQLSIGSGTYSLTPGSNCTYAVDFIPTVAGTNSGSLILNDNSLNVSGASQTVLLSGTGIGIATITTLSATPNPSTFGQTVTLTATVTGGTGLSAPTGTVSFYSGSQILGTGAVSASGAAIYSTTTLSVGSITLSATYSGDNNNDASTSVSLTETVNKNTPTVVVTPTSSNITTVQSLSVTVAVSGNPTGTVTLSSGSYISGAIALSSGSATINIPAGALAVGSDTLTASYSGDSNYIANSGTASVLVVPQGLAISGAAVTLLPGAATGNASTITVTPTGGFTGNVVLTAAITSSPSGAQDLPGLSFGATSPVSITGVSAGTATLTIITTAASTGRLKDSTQGEVRWYTAGAALACLLLSGLSLRRRRAWRWLAMIALTAIFAGGLTACGGGGTSKVSNPGTTAGAYTITVTGTAGALTAQSTINLTVQ